MKSLDNEKWYRARKSICYHGTDKLTAPKILSNGFKKDTYYARHLEDAICFGGLHVFEVVFLTSGVPDEWQFRCDEPISPDRIVSYCVFTQETILENKKLRREIFESNQESSPTGGKIG